MERVPCPDCGALAWYASTGATAILLDEDDAGGWVHDGRYGRTPRGAAPVVVKHPETLALFGPPASPYDHRYRRHVCKVGLPPLERNTAALGRAHPTTSADAAAFVLPRTGTQRRRILEQLTARGPATDDDLEEALGLPHQSASARRNGLVADGWLEALCDDTGDVMTRRNRNGNPAILWTLTDAARAALR